jgi:hypothetical protein
VAQRQSNSIAASVLANSDLVRHISTFFLPNIITADPSIQGSDAVRERIEARLSGSDQTEIVVVVPPAVVQAAPPTVQVPGYFQWCCIILYVYAMFSIT